MSYELINEDLGVYSCNILDLTLEEACYFTELWNDGSSIESLTVFNDTDGRIVINKDHKQFETFKKMVLDYMQLTEEEREEIEASIKSESIKSIFRIIDNVLKYRERKKEDEEFAYLKKMLEQQSYFWDANKTIQRLYNSYEPGLECFGLCNIYNYGVIQGKRAERAKKARSSQALSLK